MNVCTCGLPLYPHCWPRARKYRPCDVLICDECGQVEQPTTTPGKEA